MTSVNTREHDLKSRHPYLSGNFAPIHRTLPLTACSFHGQIPDELAGGEYVRNGGNPISNDDLGRDSHWFDGDGMLSGVSFPTNEDGQIKPEFVNQFILTDVYLSTIGSRHVKRPILPSITTLVNPLGSLLVIVLHILRTIFLVILSFLPGSRQAIKRISVANTSILYHDGRALATCESGPPMRVSLPGLETIGWYNGDRSEGESAADSRSKGEVFGGSGMLSWMREWTTGHPKVDPITKEMILFHATFLAPYVRYSVTPAIESPKEHTGLLKPSKLINEPVPGISGAKMMHDFGASLRHTVIMDLPLSLDPLNLAKGKPVIDYDSSKPSRFAVFPRHRPDQVRYFETTACCIFHTANTWDDVDATGATQTVHMLAARLISSTLVYAAGNIAAPQPPKLAVGAARKRGISWFEKYEVGIYHSGTDESRYFDAEVFEDAPSLESPRTDKEPLIRLQSNGQIDTAASSLPEYSEYVEQLPDEEEQCRLYHYAFSLTTGLIESQYALSAIPFEFPCTHPKYEMQAAQYVYGCSTTVTSFGAALGKATKINALVKIDTKTLIAQGESLLKNGKMLPVTGCVDARSVNEILKANIDNDPIRVFRSPEGWYVQEPRFVPRFNAQTEDDGYLLTYAFNEAQLDADGDVPDDNDCDVRSRSELWIIDAKDMTTIIGRVVLPQRVPYGLHGCWFPKEQIESQRPHQKIRVTPINTPPTKGVGSAVTNICERLLS
ncbi:hypothetical protein AAFC00_004100 [Neodothiora populina]|uniref:Carotenoid oxygenase n=1 Tax=Neodothiora populina TaxID=2781224 RepID=A0ABR3PIV6_9PEZI